MILSIILIGVIIFFWKNPNLLKSELKTFRSRFTISKKYINAYGIKLFGNRIALGSKVFLSGYGNTYGYLDNGIFRILVEMGLVYFCLFFYRYIASIRRMIKSRDTIMIVYSFLFIIYGFMEYSALLLAFNIFLIAIIGNNNYTITEVQTSDFG